MNKVRSVCFSLLKIFVGLALLVVLAAAVTKGPFFISSFSGVELKQLMPAFMVLFGAMCCFVIYFLKIKHKYKVALVILVAFLLRILWVLNVKSVLVSDFLTVYNSARGFLAGNKGALEGYGYLARFPHLVPMMVYMMGMIKLFGGWHIAAMKGVSLILSVVSVWLVYRLSGYYVKSKKVRLFAVSAAALFPPFIAYTSTFCTETIGVPLFLCTMCLFNRAEEGKKYYSFLLCGAMLYISNLFRGVGLVFLIAFIIYLLIFSKKKWYFSIPNLAAGYVITAVLVSGILLITNVTEAPLWQGKEPSYVTLMLKGSNFEYEGMWNSDDAHFVDKHLKSGNLTEECIKVIKERWSSKNPLELAGFYGKKFITQWSVGDLSGVYWATINTDIPYSQNMLIGFQHIYAILIFLSALVVFTKRSNMKVSLLLILLCGFGIAFTLLETQGRYSYIVSWVFIILASCGVENIKKVK